MKNKVLKILASAFIVVNLMMMIRAQLPSNAPVINYVYKPVTFVQNYFSLWRGWSMFAPNPLRTNQYVDAKVTFADGTSIIWNFPNASETNVLKRYLFSERYRKYSSDALRLDSKKFLWEDSTKYIVRKLAVTHAGKQPLSITLRRRWEHIPKWNKSFREHGRVLDTKKFRTYEYYTYKVAQ
jgi:hypothetical protein